MSCKPFEWRVPLEGLSRFTRNPQLLAQPLDMKPCIGTPDSAQKPHAFALQPCLQAGSRAGMSGQRPSFPIADLTAFPRRLEVEWLVGDRSTKTCQQLQPHMSTLQSRQTHQDIYSPVSAEQVLRASSEFLLQRKPFNILLPLCTREIFAV